MLAAIAVMRFLALPRPATNLALRSVTIWAAGSRSPGTSSFSRSITTSGPGSGRPDRPPHLRFCPSYQVRPERPDFNRKAALIYHAAAAADLSQEQARLNT